MNTHTHTHTKYKTPRGLLAHVGDNMSLERRSAMSPHIYHTVAVQEGITEPRYTTEWTVPHCADSSIQYMGEYLIPQRARRHCQREALQEM